MDLTYPDPLQIDAETAGFLDRIAGELDSEYVRSLLLFGTAVTGERSSVSDIDLLVVLTDGAPTGYDREVRDVCSAAAGQVETGPPPGRVDRYLSDRTGMFRSGFVTREHSLREGRFHAAFDTSRIAYFVTPWRTVLANVFESAVPVYGPPIEPDWGTIGHPRDRPYREVLTSALLAMVIAVAQLPYQFVSPGSVQYTLEAYKWSLYDCTYHVCPDRDGGLSGALDCLPDLFRLHGRFLRGRATPRFDPLLVLGTPIAVAFYHLWTVWQLARAEDSG